MTWAQMTAALIAGVVILLASLVWHRRVTRDESLEAPDRDWFAEDVAPLFAPRPAKGGPRTRRLCRSAMPYVGRNTW